MTDGGAPESIVRQFLGNEAPLKEYILILVRDPHDADDVFQEVGVRVLGKTDAPSDPQRFAAWCRGIARNLVLHHWRSRRRGRAAYQERFMSAVETAYAEADAGGDDWGDHRIALADCVKKLPELSRKIVEMRYAEGVLSEEIARQLQRTAAAVRMALMRAREGLAECIEARLQMKPQGGS